MVEKIKVADLPVFDIADYLSNDEDIENYLTLVLEEGDNAELLRALGHIGKARGMTQLAKDSGLTREALYKALRADSQPRFDTVYRVCKALGFRLGAHRAPSSKNAQKEMTTA